MRSGQGLIEKEQLLLVWGDAEEFRTGID